MGGILGNLAFVCSEIWKQIGVAQRASILLLGLLGLGVLGGVLYFGTRPNWHVVYSNIPQETAAKVYEMAKDAKIPVRLTNSGRTVQVPYKHVAALRAQAISSDIDVTQKGVGLELFDDLKLGMTEMQQRVGWQRAMQGELERMISRIDGVKSARVILAIPERRVFRRDEEQKGEGSVFLQLSRSQGLEPMKVQSICRMVAGSVPGLRPEDVTVTDSTGRLPARGSEDGTTATGMAQYLELQKNTERHLREKAEAVLRPIVGVDSVVAVVNVEVDDSDVETITETYDAGSSVIISEKTVSEDNAKTDAMRGRAAGTASNMVSVRDPKQTTAARDQTTESHKTMENEYAVPKVTRRTTGHSPRIKRLSVAVTIAQAADAPARDAAVLAQYKDLVSSAVGAMPGGGEDDRADSVTVVEGVFAARKAEEPPPAASSLDKALGLAQRVSFAQFGRPVAAAILLLVLYRMFGGMLRRNQLESVDLTTTQMAAAEALPEGSSGSGILGEVASVPAGKVRKHAEEDPADVAATLEAWMARDSKFE